MKFYFKNIKELIFILGVEKKYIFFLIFLFFSAGFVDLLSLGMVAPYVAIVFDSDNAFNYDFFKLIGLKETNQKNVLFLLSIILIILFFLKGFFSVFIRWLIDKFTFTQHAALQVKLLSAYQDMKYESYISRNSSEYIRNVRELSSQAVNSAQAYLRTASELIILVSVVIYLGFVNFKILIFLLLIISPIYFIYEYFLKPINVRLGLRRLSAIKYIYKGIDAAIKGFKEIRVLSKEEFFRKIIRESGYKELKSNLNYTLIKDSPRYVFEFAIITAAIMLVLITSNLVEDMSLFLPTAAVFMVAALRILPGISIIVNGLTQVSFNKSGVATVFEDLKTSYNLRKIINSNNKNKNKNDSFKSIVLKNLKFKYKNSEKHVFKNINFSLKENECIGIVGESGAGKTTLVDILLGFLTPQDGEVYVNERPASNIALAFSKNIAYLPQEPVILEEDLKTNIVLEIDITKIDQEKLDKSIIQANLKKVIDSLPNGLNTIIGEDGVRLSVGQNRRVALARTFYHGKKIMIMDEATSALDPNTESYIVEQIKEIKGKKTILIITHRISTLIHCDKIYKIENNEIKRFK